MGNGDIGDVVGSLVVAMNVFLSVSTSKINVWMQVNFFASKPIMYRIRN